uniref:Zinc metalloproteinase n=1 Tax=Parastrongyloides trichosuri TaxID=131310 RepID=A0A0N4Z4H3_PARTI
MRLQKESEKGMSKGGKKDYEKHLKSMDKLMKISNEFHGGKGKSDPKNETKEGSEMMNPLFYEGDMILNPKQAEYLIEEAKLKLEAKKSGNLNKSSEKEIANKLKKNRAFKKNSKYKWTFPIPYYVDSSLSDKNIDIALKNIEKETCVRFKKMKSLIQQPGLRFFKGTGCYSYIGPIYQNRPQDVSIGYGCDYVGIIEHEAFHALGVFHEQSRPDRDNYLSIHLENVSPSMKHNYAKSSLVDSEAFGVPYDYGSVMQYGRTAFSNNGKDTMVPKNSFYKDVIGNKGEMQFNDIKLINKALCSTVCKEEIECENGGYQDPNNCGACKCPSMLTGSTCEKLIPNKMECGGYQKIDVTKELKTLDLIGTKHCVYSLESEEGKKINVNITNGYTSYVLFGTCLPGMGLEIKYASDKTLTGANFCGYISNKTFVSEGNKIFIRYNGQSEKHYAKIEYNAI